MLDEEARINDAQILIQFVSWLNNGMYICIKFSGKIGLYIWQWADVISLIGYKEKKSSVLKYVYESKGKV